MKVDQNNSVFFLPAARWQEVVHFFHDDKII